MIQFVVYGVPGPKGSKTLKGSRTGHYNLVESSKLAKPWAEAVKWAAFEAGRFSNWKQITGPVYAEIIFTLAKPRSAPKRKKLWPDRKPDIDKLCRSTLDALTNSGLIEDDARVVDLIAGKRYPLEGTDALERPGAIIRISGANA